MHPRRFRGIRNGIPLYYKRKKLPAIQNCLYPEKCYCGLKERSKSLNKSIRNKVNYPKYFDKYYETDSDEVLTPATILVFDIFIIRDTLIVK